MDDEPFDPTTATLADLDRHVADADRELDRLGRRLTEARSRHRSAVDENPLAQESESIRDELDKLRRPELDAEEEAVERDAEAVRARLLAVAQAAGTGQPTLPPGLASEAADKLPFVRMQCEGWPLDKLSAALRYCLGVDDRAALYGYLQALPGRLAAKPDSPGPTDPVRGRLNDPDARRRAELQKMLRVAERRLTDDTPSVTRLRAHDLATRGFDLARDAGRRRRERERHSQVYGFQQPGDISLRTGKPIERGSGA